MDRNGFSLLFVPHGGESRKGTVGFRLSGTALAVAATVGLFTMVAVVAMAFTYGSVLVDQMRFAKLQRENDILRGELTSMNESVMVLRGQMDVIAERDEILRNAAELDPLPQELRRVGVGGTYRDFNSEVLLLSARSGKTAMETQSTLNQLLREAALELESLLEIEDSLTEFETFLNGFPSIWPIDREKYSGVWVSSPYGLRTHPVTGEKNHFHPGNDIVAPRGTPVRATADGRIERFQDGLRKGSTWYLGNYVKIDHGNGYVTYYGHLDHLHPRVRRAARVKRGDIVGYVGNTGRTTGYHLHYEIHFGESESHSADVNPWWHYYEDRMNDLLDRRR